ncbi:MAG: UvrD-helicase domain-containing protein, partial [Planctomycetes bacterium]|nr:UvrD-helicase domain-containing protein [Planctomycetota bacterium]
MTQITFTPQQQQAVTACGSSVIVSAAAGSGKTAVLAARCAYLVCDAPGDKRCNVDELLVVTFTEAAAAEMRSRIVEAMRERASQDPEDARLREQVALADVAAISTVHAFCQRIIRGWFSELDIDPGAALMDEHEAAL